MKPDRDIAFDAALVAVAQAFPAATVTASDRRTGILARLPDGRRHAVAVKACCVTPAEVVRAFEGRFAGGLGRAGHPGGNPFPPGVTRRYP